MLSKITVICSGIMMGIVTTPAITFAFVLLPRDVGYGKEKKRGSPTLYHKLTCHIA
jgi:hypothetical protein